MQLGVDFSVQTRHVVARADPERNQSKTMTLKRLNFALKLKPRVATALLATFALVALAPVAAQVGHPAKGSWIGYWGPDAETQNRILLVLNWQERQLTGVINPGRDSVAIDRADIDYDTWTMTIEARMPAADGGTKRFVTTGRLENLGSWVNRRYAGTYRHGEETGEFSLTLN
jgi:hypothetical protein